VQPGDTLAAIALRFGTTWQAIAMANALANPNVIFVGQILRIP
jgi:LysM repeat protein